MIDAVPTLAWMIEYDTGINPLQDEVFDYRPGPCDDCADEQMTARVSLDGETFRTLCGGCYHRDTRVPPTVKETV